VKERTVGSAAAPPQPPAAAGSASFPAAVHRKQSKVRRLFCVCFPTTCCNASCNNGVAP
jgi:hypothetical protein